MRQDKNKAISLRKGGKSYNEISKILGAPKSTLSLWLRNIKMSPEIEKKFLDRTKKKWSKSITEFNKKQGKIAKEKAEKRQQVAVKDIKRLSKRELLLVGVALYWAEGSKGRWALQFTNSDPDMIMLMMKFFRNICEVPESKIKASAQIHPNVTPQKVVNYWSKISGISKKNFHKTYCRVSPSSKFKRPSNKLPYGTLRIEICNIEMVDKVKGWIRGIAK
ncbi:MAG: hypothetical protein ABII95_01265 [Patescibacteria group bacterium]